MEQHPLTEMVLRAYKNTECLDGRKLADFLWGGAKVSRPEIDKVERAYKIVAEHVLESMLRDGILQRDEQGWYRLASERM